VNSTDARPEALRHVAAELIVHADVRDELRAGREPFALIMAARRALQPGGALCVRAIFEPVPLYTVMKRQGLTHVTEQRAPDDWVVWFFDGDDAPQDSPAPVAAPPASTGSDVQVLDVRGLEPPEPMERTLAALEQLPADATLVQVNERIPRFLLPLLEERGFTYEVRSQDDRLVRTFIRRAEAASLE